MKSILWYLQRVRTEIEKVNSEHDAMVYENRNIEPARDLLRCMVADPKLRDQVVDQHAKLLLGIAREAQACLDLWRFERRVLGISD
jgi:hypothetical protein